MQEKTHKMEVPVRAEQKQENRGFLFLLVVLFCVPPTGGGVPPLFGKNSVYSFLPVPDKKNWVE